PLLLASAWVVQSAASPAEWWALASLNLRQNALRVAWSRAGSCSRFIATMRNGRSWRNRFSIKQAPRMCLRAGRRQRTMQRVTVHCPQPEHTDARFSPKNQPCHVSLLGTRQGFSCATRYYRLMLISFTTCCTLGTAFANCSASLRWPELVTFPFKV